MKKKSLLFVSIAFPPKADAEGLQVAKYLKYLLREGWSYFDIDVVTSQVPTLNMTYDQSLEFNSIGIRQCIEIPIFENKYTNFILRKLACWLVERPDSKFTFHHQAFRIPKLLFHSPAIIYSRSFPISSAVMAYKLKKYYKVPWIMHLSDPWADCPLTQFRDRSLKYNQRMEKKCFENADIICVTSNKTVDFYKEKYSYFNKRIELFPNVFDSEDIVHSRKSISSYNDRDNSTLRIVYTGSLIGDRSPEPFLQALSLLSSTQQNKLEVIFAGEADRKNKAILNNYQLSCISYYGVVEYQQALKLQRSADILLLIDMPVNQPELRVFFPSKILDYIIAKKPILALVDSGSETEFVITSNQLGTCIERHCTQSIKEHLIWLLKSKGTTYFDEREILPEYDAHYNAKRLITLFQELLAC